MIDSTISLYALLFANASLVAAGSLAVLRFQRTLHETSAFWQSPAGAAMRTELPAQNDHGEMLVHEIAALQETVADLRDREPIHIETSPGRLPFENAVRMVKHGASVEDLTTTCGLNIGEAQLMRRLHGETGVSDPAIATA